MGARLREGHQPRDGDRGLREGESAPGSGSWRRLAHAVAAGLTLTAAVTVARFTTEEPYGPLLIPFDATLLVGGLVTATLAFGLPRWGWLRERGNALPLRFAAATALWIWALEALHVDFRGAIGLGAAVPLMALALPVSRRPARIPFSITLLVLGLALGISLHGYGYGRTLGAVFPVALVALVAAGVLSSTDSPRTFGAFPTFLALGTLAVCSLAPPPLGNRLQAGAPSEPRAQGPSVVLIVLDTLRRDHMSLYGYERPTTPNLDRWSEGARVFDQSTATSSWTLPSHASLFTGLYPRTHAARGFRGEGKEPSRYPLRRDTETLAEVLGRAGLRTAGLVANHYLLSPEWGLDQGFQDYTVCAPAKGYRFKPADKLAERLCPYAYEEHHWAYFRARKMTDLALDWLGENGDAPYFLFLNYMDVHRPNWRRPTASIPLEDEHVRIPQHENDLPQVLEFEPLPERTTRGLVNAYDRELAVLDAEVARLLEAIEASGRGDETYVVITSDHGEYFGEHDLIDHMVFLYNETVDVPLIVKGPGIEPGRSSAPVQSVDVFPTVLELFGLRDADPRQGHSVLDEARSTSVCEWYSASDPLLRDPRFGGRFDHDLTTIALDGLRLHRFANGHVELYDLATDPRETTDLAPQRPTDVERLTQELEAWLAAHPLVPGKKLDPVRRSARELERIRSLGYTGAEDPGDPAEPGGSDSGAR